MKSSGRHERDYFEAAIEVAPPALQALSAVAITFALTFAGHRFVPDWSVAFSLILGVATLIAASLWSWQARRLLLARPDKAQRTAETRLLAVNSRSWLAAALVSSLSLIGLSAYLVITGIRPNPSFASPYDGTDPGTSPCVHSAQPISDQGRPTLRDLSGRPVGYVQLVRSVACATVWARVILQPSAVAHLKGDFAIITMVRPGDNAEAEYPLLLHGGTIGFGNMLSDSQSCVIAQVTIKSSNYQKSGPETVTACR
jgi:hypothetical protein